MRGPYVLIAALLIFWIAVTGSLAPGELALGFVIATSVGIAMWRLFGKEAAPLVLSAKQALRFAAYAPYLVKEIVKANIDVAERVLDPRLPISPTIVPFSFPLKSEISVVALANSITLTPGTLTVDVDGDTFYVHCLGEEFADGLAQGGLYRHIHGVFEED